MKKKLPTILLFVVLLIGLSLLLYPTFSDWWNSFHQSQAVTSYVEQVANIDNNEYEKIWNEDAIGADNTVAVHIRHIREKIEINPKEPRYLKVVWGVGYKIEKQ